MISKSSTSAAGPETWEPPRSGGFHSAEEPSAFTRPGTAWCRQPIIRSGINCPTTCRTDTGYGRGAFRMQPVGISIRKGASEAQLFGTSGATTHLIPKQE